MRVRTITALGAAAGLALGACSTNREVTEPEPVPVTSELLGEALVTAEEVEGATATGDGGGFGADLVEVSDCDEVLAQLAPEQSASRSFDVGRMTVTHRLGWFPGSGGGAEAAYHEMVNSCAATVTEAATVRAGSLDFGVLSDDTVAFKLEVEPRGEGAIREIDVILVRRGDILGVITARGPRPSDKRTLDQAARAAINNVSGLERRTT